ncbi:acyltransferase [Caballeronia sp. RCC_10]|uniref:acyltransferase n=1 Tax=Caballeronia sp. RCC_10 TaxID=3239227 RepID=UPI003525E55E
MADASSFAVPERDAVSRSGSRSVQLDLARSLATVVVVMIHLNDRIFDPIAPVATHGQWLLHAVLNAIGRLAVPVFFMISGSLVLARADSAHILRFYRKRIPQFMVVLIFYSLVTNYVAYRMGYESSFEPSAILSDLLAGRMRDAFHLWFIPALIGVYIVAPFINAMQRAGGAWILIWYCVLTLLLTVLPFTVGAVAAPRPWTVGVGQFFGCYLMYFVVGHLVVNARVAERVPTAWLALAACVAIIAAITVQYRMSLPGAPFAHIVTDYSSLFTVIPSVCLFITLMRVRVGSASLQTAVERFSRLGFGIYLVHLAMLHFVLRTLESHWSSTYGLMVPSLMLIVMLSYGYSFAMSKFAILRKLVL